MRYSFLLIMLCAVSLAQAAPGLQTDTGSIHFLNGLTMDSRDLAVEGRHATVRFSRSYNPDSSARWDWNQRWQPLVKQEQDGTAVLSRGSTNFGGRPIEPGNELEFMGRKMGRRGGCGYESGEWVCDYATPEYVRPGSPTIKVLEDGYRWESPGGNWIRYDQDGKVIAYGNFSQTHAQIERDGQGRIAEIRNADGGLLATVGYADQQARHPSYVEDYTGRRVSYEYDADGQLTEVTDVRGKTWQYDYNSDGELTAFTDPRGNTTSYGYDLDDNTQYRITYADGYQVDYNVGADSSDEGITVVYERHPDGTIRERRHGRNSVNTTRRVPGTDEKVALTYSLRVNDELVEEVYATEVGDSATERYRLERQPDGTFQASRRDLQGRLVRRWYSDGTEETWTYATNSHQVKAHTDRRGTVTRYQYNDDNRPAKMIEAEGTAVQRTTRYTYPDDSTRVITRSGPGGPDTEVREILDEYGNVIERRDPEGNTTTYTYNVQGQVLTRTLPSGASYSYSYDEAGNLLNEQDPLERTTQYRYDEAGNRIRETAPNQAVTQYEYDSRNARSAIIDPYDHRTEIERDRENRERIVINPLDHESRQIKTPLGMPRSMQDADGNTVNMEWNGVQLKKANLPTFERRFQYSERQIESIAEQWAGGQRETRFKRNPHGQIRKETDALENSTNREYDALERVTRIQDAEGGVARLAYDYRDNLISVTDPEGRVTRFEYNRNDQVTAEIRTPESGVEHERTYAYDADGNLTEEITPEGQKLIYEYDDAAQLIGIELYDNQADSGPVRAITFTYTALGQIAGYSDENTSVSYDYSARGQMVQATTDYGPFSKTITYSYDAVGRMKTYTNPENITYRYHYTPGGQIQRIEIPNEGDITFTNWQWHRAQLIQLPGGNRIERRFDGLMRMTENRLVDSAGMDLLSMLYDYDVVDNLRSKQTSEGDTQYDYDPLYRLTLADYPGESEETFDYDGVDNRTQHTRTDKPQDELEPLKYNEANQLIQRGDTYYEYNANGNLVREEGPEGVKEYIYNARERLVQVKDGNDATIARYGYNPLGRRMWKEVNGTRTYFFYNKSGLVGEYDVSGNLMREYHYMPQEAWMTRPLFLRKSAQIYYYNNDQLGTPQKLIAKNGAVVWDAKTHAFGESEIADGMVINPLRFPGQYHDAETGLNHNYYRDYHPSLGRYLQADPIGLDGGINPYSYAYQNPNKFSDPLGLRALQVLRMVRRWLGLVGTADDVRCHADQDFDHYLLKERRKIFIEDWEMFYGWYIAELRRCKRDFEDDAGLRYQCWDTRLECEFYARVRFEAFMEKATIRHYRRFKELHQDFSVCSAPGRPSRLSPRSEWRR
ncbi:RHS repeat domain-containing protein [Halospina denitrificans]|nr:RHS repeat-associated core domain-containing protein [Halospina denitrificans]